MMSLSLCNIYFLINYLHENMKCFGGLNRSRILISSFEIEFMLVTLASIEIMH